MTEQHSRANQMREISARSRLNSSFFLKIAKPSANACIIPYSIPLCTIFTKCPEPLGPTYPQPVSADGASVFQKLVTATRPLLHHHQSSYCSLLLAPKHRRSYRHRCSGYLFLLMSPHGAWFLYSWSCHRR